MRPSPVSVLLADDEQDFLTVIEALLESSGYRVVSVRDGAAALSQLQSTPYDVTLLDVRMPRITGTEVLRQVREQGIETQVIMITGVTDVRLAVECMQLGAFSYLTKPPESTELLAIIERAVERKQLLVENKALRSELSRHAGSERIIGTSKPITDLLAIAARVAPTDSTVLLQGASGTGKELIASFIHRKSARADGPFIALNCAAVPDTLIESELFGHEKGAFTDAIAQRQGLVEMANGGTLFLDEVGEISLMMQPKLLRFLQTGEFRRVGGNKALTSDVRVISATNKDLRQRSTEGRFREDLLYRLNVITLEVPPLRNRPEDIPLLVDHFLKDRMRTHGVRGLDPNAMELLRTYEWPGNVRELENIIERAAILCRDGVIRSEDLALPLGHPLAAPAGASLLGTAVAMRDVEKEHIAGVLRLTEWNKTQAAEILGISLKTLYTKIQQFNLSRP